MKKWLRILSFSSIALFSLYLLILSFFIYTSFGKELLTSFVKKEIERQKIPLKIGSIAATSPLSFIIEDTTIQIENVSLHADTIDMKISLLPFLLQKLSLPSVQIANLTIVQEKKTLEKQLITTKPFLTSIEIASLKIDHLLFNNEDIQIQKESNIFSNRKKLLFSLELTKKTLENSFLKLDGQVTTKTGKIFLRSQLYAASILSLNPSLKNLAGELNISTSISSSIQDIISFFEKKEKTTLLSGECTATLTPSGGFFHDTLHLTSKYTLSSDYLLEMPLLSIKSSEFSLFGQLTINKEFQIQKADFALNCPSLSDLFDKVPITGALACKVSTKQDNKLNFSGTITPFSLYERDIDVFHFFADCSISVKEIAGEVTLQAEVEKIPFKLLSEFNYTVARELTFSKTECNFGSLELQANGKWLPDFLVQATIVGKASNSEFLSIFADDLPSCLFSFKANLEPKNDKQALNLEADVGNFSYENIFFKTGHLQTDIDSLSQRETVLFSLQGSNFQYRTFLLEEFSMQAEKKAPSNSILFSGKSGFLDITTSGTWSSKKNIFSLHLPLLEGHFQKTSFTIKDSFELRVSPTTITVKPFDLLLKDGKIHVGLKKRKEDISCSLEAENFPLQMLFPTLVYPLKSSGKAHFLKKGADVEATLVLQTENQNDPFVSQSIEVKLKEKVLQGQAQLVVDNEKLFFSSFSIPLEISTTPLRIAFNEKKSLDCTISAEGKIEKLLSFFPVTSHKIEGELRADLHLTNTLLDPNLNGTISLVNGVYENYYTGTYIQKGEMTLIAKGKELLFVKMQGSDGKKGTIVGKGSLLVDLTKKLPFNLHFDLSHFLFSQSDIATAEAKGTLDLSGDLSKALASGKLRIEKAKIQIPEKMPMSVIELPVTFIGPPPATIPEVSFSILDKITPLYPLHLNIKIVSSSRIQVEGRGLTSTWKGALSLTGTYQEPQFKGNLKLTRGQFLFSNQTFFLTDGLITFKNDLKGIPTLSISGNTSIKGTTILAELKGPINSPELSFGSIPPLAPSSIMALLIFGKDISEVTGIQALQLIATAGSFSEGAHILDSIRQTLGIDRLSFVSTPATKVDEADKVAVKVGKYIIKGVLVSLSQGLEQGSTNLIVEADLTHGFTLQAETQQEEEQGKFTLKWNKNY